jgi:hypothetical protein
MPERGGKVTGKPWAAVSVHGAVHLLPVYDTFDHEAVECWCEPVVIIDRTGKTVYHNADDMREFEEMGH